MQNMLAFLLESISILRRNILTVSAPVRHFSDVGNSQTLWATFLLLIVIKRRVCSIKTLQPVQGEGSDGVHTDEGDFTRFTRSASLQGSVSSAAVLLLLSVSNPS